MSKRIWLTWEIQQRNRSLSQRLSAELIEITSSRARPVRYTILIARTIRAIHDANPTTIFAQNPSIVLALLALAYAKLKKIRIIIDAHNGGILPLEGKYRILNRLAQFIHSSSDFVIISNQGLIRDLGIHKNKVIVIPDPIPSLDTYADFKCDEKTFNIVFICSWASDEPYENAIEAAKLIPDNIRIYITGNHKNRLNETPPNVTLTGYLSEDRYNALLLACDAVMVLTTRENCLVCGAYEGTAAEKPLLLSNKKALRLHFRKGAVFTDHEPKMIAQSITTLASDRDNLSAEIAQLKQILIQEMNTIITSLDID